MLGHWRTGVAFLSKGQASPPVLSEQDSLAGCGSEPENQGGIPYSSLLSLCCENSTLPHYLGLLDVTEGFNP